MNITNDLINSLAVNNDSVKNGKNLFTSKKFVKLGVDSDKKIIFGECAGSGKNPYYCSMDFLNEASPVPRCSCPSRQIPCKHVLGLMIAYEQASDQFVTLDIPEDIVEKRNKKEKAAEKKATKEANKDSGEKKVPKEKSIKAKTTAETKKIANQLQGIENAKELFRTIVNNGLASIDANKIKELKTQVKNLGNYHINGVASSFSVLLETILKDDENFIESIEQLNYINALLTKAEKYLTEKTENPLTRDISCKIEEQIGHIWNYNELDELGLSQEKAQLVQLYFEEEDNKLKKEFIETGIWFELSSKKLCKTVNIRPYKAMKHIKEEDSVKSCVTVDELYFYPSENTPRVTIKEPLFRDVTTQDLNVVKETIQEDYATVVKDIKNIFKAPLSDKELYYLVKVDKIRKFENGLIIENSKGENLVINGDNNNMIEFMYGKDLQNRVMLIKVSKELVGNGFKTDLISIVRDTDVFMVN